MKNNDCIIPNVSEIKTVSSAFSPKDRTINATSEDRASSFNSSSSSSSSSSPSDLRKRLEDLQSPSEFTLLADRVATLGRRISRKRELFVRLHGAVNRIEENDEWEEREQRARSEGSLGALRPKDARARRRARVRLETSNGDEAMVVSQTGDPIGPSKTTDSNDRSNPGETVANRSARDHNYMQSSTIEVSRRQPRPTSLSEPSSTRSAYCSNATWHETTSGANVHDFRSFTPRDSAERSVGQPSVAPFSFSKVRPKKFGGYRPSPDMILKNLSSDSESESAGETNRAQRSCVQRVGDATASLELSSPASKSTALAGPVKKMPVLSARSDITQSILPNLLPSTRSLQESTGTGHPISQEALRTACVPGQLDRNESSIRFPKMENVTLNTSARAFCNKQTTCDEFPTKIPNEAWNIAARYECDAKEEMSENTPSFLDSRAARNFMQESAEFESTNVYNEPINRDLPNNYDKFGQARFEENSDRQDRLAAKWDQMTHFYENETVDKPGMLEEAKASVTEELALWSEISESFESEDHSRSSYRATMSCSQKNASSNRRSGNDTDMSDKYEQETIMVTNVPTLALNSQDISYSTSAGSRECPAMQSLDPRALMNALSDVSLKRERQESASRKRDDVYRLDNDAPSSRVPDHFSTKGETWRVPRSSTSESSRKSLTRIPSKIPIRISSSKNTPFTNVNKLSGSHTSETLRKIANEERAQFMDQSEVQNEMNTNSTRQRLVINSETCKQYSVQRPRDESIKAAIVGAHSSRSPSNIDGIAEYEANNYDKPESSVSLNLPSPRTPFGNEIYEKMDRSSDNGFTENIFFNEASYSSNRDYAKIDDDVRSKSDRSTSRKTADTVDITSATESPYLCSKYKHDSIPRNESSRNRGEVGENTAWRTEDEYASINNEEDPENLKNKHYYDSSRNKAEETYPQTEEHFESKVEQECHWPPSKSQPSPIDLSLEIERIVRKQSRASNDPNFDNSEPTRHQDLELTEVTETESLTSHVRRTQKICSFASRMTSSTLNLSCEPKRKRKSQERFPFTISEASRAFSTEHVDTSDNQCFDKHSDRINVVDPRSEEKTHQLKMHPSITRLATSGVEDTMAEILCCVAQEQRDNESSSKSRMRALMRMLSSKLRKTSKQRNDKRTVESTRIIYENHACRMDSKTNSCSSGDSSAEKAHRLNKSSNNWTDHPSNSIFDRTESIEAITGKHSYRKYDRDNLWVRDIEDSLLDEKKDSNVTREETEEIDSKRNQSDKLSKSDNNRNSGNEEQENVPTRSHLLPADGKEKRDDVDDQTTSRSVVPKVEETEQDSTGCSCLRLYRSLAPFKHRSSIREQATSSRIKMSSFLLRRRKK